MSGIFGIFNRDNHPVDFRAMADMARAMDYWGPDGSTQWIEGPGGLGHLMLHTTPESLHEKQPLISSCKNYILVSHARIDNRVSLFDRLGIPANLRKNMPDNELIMRSWEKWGGECPKNLFGDWVFALFDKRRRRLFLAKDHCGISGLYYYATEKQFIFASSLKGLFALHGVPRKLNAEYLGHFLIRQPRSTEETFYKDIFRLPPASTIQVSQSGFLSERYWNLDKVQDTRFSSDEDYIESFMELYTEAVKARLRSIKPVGAQLSGGLDSGSVVALAARELKQQGKFLHTFSSVPLYDVSRVKGYPDRFLDETPFIQATADFNTAIVPHFCKARQMSPSQAVQRGLSINLQPTPAALNQYWILSLYQGAKQKNCGVLLSGRMGNYTVSWPGKSEKQTRIQRLMYQLKHDPYFFSALSLKVKKRLMVNNTKSLILKGVRSSLNPHFLKAIPPNEQSHESDFGQAHGVKNIVAEAGAIPYEIGTWFGLEVRDPTADKRLVEYCCSLPNQQYWRQGTGRCLIRRSMTGLLPDKVRLNTRRGKQAGDIGYRVLNDPDVTPILASLYKSPWFIKVFDIKENKKLQKHIGGDFFESSILIRNIMIGLFLKTLET